MRPANQQNQWFYNSTKKARIFSFVTSTVFLYTIIVTNSFAQDSTTEKKIKQYQQKINLYLDKEKALNPYYTIDTNGIGIFASQQKKEQKEQEFFLNWQQVDVFAKFLSLEKAQQSFETYLQKALNDSIVTARVAVLNLQPLPQTDSPQRLKGLKIAIDPGHIAGDMETGNIEKKSLTFKNNDSTLALDSIRIAEGMLTFATAQLLKNKLEAEGADVFMTRNFNGSTAFGYTYDDWLKNEYRKTVDSLFTFGKISQEQKIFFSGSKASKRDKFRVIFKDAELAHRADVINEYQPDFTIVIHYNVDETNIAWKQPSKKNFNMTFIGGAFMKNDLPTHEKRFEFLRLLLTNDMEQSVDLSAAVVQNFEKILEVKTAGIKDAEYLQEGCLPTSQPGVFCRNLQLTRYIHGPIVYGETLYQDNEKECLKLCQEEDKTKNERVQQVAEAYFKGVLEYVEKHNKK